MESNAIDDGNIIIHRAILVYDLSSHKKHVFGQTQNELHDS